MLTTLRRGFLRVMNCGKTCRVVAFIAMELLEIDSLANHREKAGELAGGTYKCCRLPNAKEAWDRPLLSSYGKEVCLPFSHEQRGPRVEGCLAHELGDQRLDEQALTIVQFHVVHVYI